MLSTGTFEAANIASLASTTTPGVAAVAVNTLAAGAFVVDGASLPVILLGYARGAEAVGVITAVAVLSARVSAWNFAVALVGAAWDWTGLGAGTVPATVVSWEVGIAATASRIALGSFGIVGTARITVAEAVVAAPCKLLRTTVFLRVRAQSNVLARTSAVAGTALAAFCFHVIVVAVGGASTFATTDVTGGAFAVAGVVAAEAVDAEAWEAGIGTFTSCPVGHLECTGAWVITVSIVAALTAAGAGFTTLSSCAVALVRAAILGAGVEADTEAGALVSNIESFVRADLVRTGAAGNPVTAGTGAITEAVLSTSAGCLLHTVVGRVSTLSRRRTFTCTVTDFAGQAAVFRVSVVGVEGAGTLQPVNGTSFAEIVTGSVAAVAVNTEAGAALIIAHAGLALVALGLALVLLAPVTVAAVTVFSAERTAALAFAHVGAAVRGIGAAADVPNSEGTVTAGLREVAEVGGFTSTSVVLTFAALADGPDSGITVATAGTSSFIIYEFAPGTESTTHGGAVELRLSECHEPTAGHFIGVRFATDEGWTLFAIPPEIATVRGRCQARTVTVAILGGGKCTGVTWLGRTDGTTGPLPAGGVAVADTILATSEGWFLCAVILRVSVFVCVVALAGAVADLAVVALNLWVAAIGVEGADTLRPGKCAGSAGAGTTAVAAVPVHTVVWGALVGLCAGLSVGLLRRADRAGAVVSSNTFCIGSTWAEAVDRVSGTLVRRTTFSTRVNADSSAVALVSWVEGRASTGLGRTNRRGIPVFASTRPTAVTVVATATLKHGRTVGLRVSALGGVLAGTAAGADSTRTTLICRVSVVSKVGTGTFEARFTTSLALTTTRSVAAVAVNAVPAGTFDVEATLITNILLLNTFTVNSTVVAEAAVVLLGAWVTAFAAVIGAGVTLAGVVATVGADAATVAGVRVEEHAAYAVLREALGAIIPVSAAAATVAVAVIATGSLGHGSAVVDGVATITHLGALVIDTSADPARRAVILGVCQTGVVRTGTFLVFQRARLTAKLAGPVAAVAVNAEASEALVVRVTGFALTFTLLTDTGVAVGVCAAMEVSATSGSATRAHSIAGVRATRIVTIIVACAPAVAHIGIAERSAVADLLDANRGDVPEVTCTGTVAGTIEATWLLERLRTLALFISANESALAATSSVADSAETTLKLRIGVGGVVGTSPLAARSGTWAAVTVTWFVAAVTVNTEPASALVVIGTRPAIDLLGDAGGTVAVIAHATVIIGGAAIATGVGATATSVWAATFGASFNAVTATVTEVSIGKSWARTGLNLADGCLIPEGAVANPITVAVQLAGAGGEVLAVILRVKALESRITATSTVAELAGATIVFGVSHVAMVGADTALTIDVAVLAVTVALVVAAYAVNAVVRGTLDVRVTGRTDNLLQNAVGSIAPVSSNTVVGLGAHLEAIHRRIVADVRSTGAWALVETFANTIAEVVGVFNTVLAVLRDTDTVRDPQAASAGTVAGTIIVAGGNRVFGAVSFGVIARGNRYAGHITVTNLAENTFIFGVSVVGNGGAGTDGTVKGAGVAASLTRGVAAVAVHTFSGETLEGVVAGFAIILLRQTVVAVAVVIFVTMFLHRTVSTAGGCIAIADVGLTFGEALVNAEPGAIAEVRGIFDSTFAELVETDGAINPESAGTGTITGTIVLAVARVEDIAVTEGIIAHEHGSAKAVAIAHQAETTLSFRVGPVIIAGAGTFKAGITAALACAVAGVLATVAVDALIRETLKSVITGITVGLLVQADLAFTVVERLAIHLNCAGEETVAALGVTNVRNTVDVGKVDAIPNAVAEVVRVFEDAGTGLVETESYIIPQSAGIVTVASTVEATSAHVRLGALTLRVNAGCGGLAVAIAIADAAETTFIFGVAIVEVVRAHTLDVLLIAGGATAFTGSVAANAVDAVGRHTLVAIATIFTEVLLRNAGIINIAVVADVAIVVWRTGFETGQPGPVTDVGFTTYGSTIVAGTIAITGVVVVYGCGGTVLIEAYGAWNPVPACTGTIAGTVEVAAGFSGGLTVISGVLARSYGDAAVVIPGADLAERTVVLGVAIERVVGASTFAISDVAGLTTTFTGSVTAVAVNAVVREALIASNAGLAVVLLGSTLIAEAVEDVLAVVVTIAIGKAIIAGTIADVGYAELGWRVDTVAITVTVVIGIERVTNASLVNADGGIVPVLASTEAVATAVEAAVALDGSIAVTLLVKSNRGVGAGTVAVADLAETTFIFWVDSRSVVDAHTGSTTHKLCGSSGERCAARANGIWPWTPDKGLGIVVGPEVNGEPCGRVEAAEVGSWNRNLGSIVVYPAGEVRPGVTHGLCRVPGPSAIVRHVVNLVCVNEGDGVVGGVTTVKCQAAEWFSRALPLVWCKRFVKGNIDLVVAQVDAVNRNIYEGCVPGKVVLDASSASTKFVRLQVPVTEGTVNGHGKWCGPGSGTGGTRSVTRIVTAVPVNTATADAFTINGASVSIGLLVGTLVVVVTPVTWHTVSILEAESAALSGVVARVRRAVFFAWVSTRTVATACIGRVENMAYTGLSNTFGLIAPELAGVCAVALTVEATIDFGTLLTFALRVSTQSGSLTLTGTVADAAKFALCIGVSVIAEVLAFANRTCLVACTASTVTGLVAANAVNAEARLALVAQHALFAVDELLPAGIVCNVKCVAPVGGHTFRVLSTGGETVKLVGITHVGRAVDGSTVCTNPESVADIHQVLGGLDAGCWCADQVCVVECAAPVTITDTVVGATRHTFVFAVILGVCIGIGIDTFCRIIANHAGTAVAIRVQPGSYDMAVTWLHVYNWNAAVASVTASCVAAVSVDAEFWAALDTFVTRFTRVLGGNASAIVVAVVTGHTVRVGRTGIETSERFFVTDVRFATLGTTVITDTATVASIGQMEFVHLAGLSDTNGPCHPLVAGASTVAATIGAAGGLLFHGALALRVRVH
jgi:hypothetical protein